MNRNDICPFYDAVDSCAVLEGDCIPDVGKLAVFKEKEVVFICKVL
jgi:hypothetical protein